METESRRSEAVVHGPEGDAADRVRVRAVPEGVDGFERPAVQSDVYATMTPNGTRSCLPPRRASPFSSIYLKKINIISSTRTVVTRDLVWYIR